MPLPEGRPVVSSDLSQLKELEPWALPGGRASDADSVETVAAALERVARQLRVGELVLPPDSQAPSDEAALALARAALLRSDGV